MWREQLEFAALPRKRFIADLVYQVERHAAQAQEAGLLENGRFSALEAVEGLDDGRYGVKWNGGPAIPLISGRLGAWPWERLRRAGADGSDNDGAATLARLARWGEQAAEIVAWFHERGRVLQGPTVNSLAVRESDGTGSGGGDGKPDGAELILTDPGAEPFLGAYRHGHVDPRHFTPPEVLKGKAWEASGDVFALGVSLFYLFTGQFPFADAEGMEQVAENIVERPPASARAFNQDISPVLDRLLGRLLSKEPGGRPEATEVARELRRLREEERLAANEAEREAASRAVVREKRRQQVTRVRRRVRWYWGAAAIAVVALAMVYWLSRPAVYVPAIGPKTTPEEVVGIYYQAMADLDTRRMEEAIDPKAGRQTLDWVSQLYVVQRMNDAMQMQSGPTGQSAPARKGATGPQEAPRRIISIESLSITRERAEGGNEFFTASYRLVLNRGDGSAAQKRVDHLRLKRVVGKWKIVELTQEVHDES